MYAKIYAIINFYSCQNRYTLAQGACVAVGGNLVTDAFGVVAMVAKRVVCVENAYHPFMFPYNPPAAVKKAR